MEHDSVQMRLRVLAVAVAPLALMIGYGLRPYLSNPRDPSVSAAAVTGAADRWIWGHLIVALGLALTILSMLAIRSWLRDKGERFWSFSSVALVACGATGLVFVMGADGLGGWALAGSESQLEAFFAGTRDWERPVYLVGATLLGAGLLALGRAVMLSGALGRIRLTIVFIGLGVAVAVAAVPRGWAVYALGVGAALASWPIALTMWREAGATGAGTD